MLFLLLHIKMSSMNKGQSVYYLCYSKEKPTLYYSNTGLTGSQSTEITSQTTSVYSEESFSHCFQLPECSSKTTYLLYYIRVLRKFFSPNSLRNAFIREPSALHEEPPETPNFRPICVFMLPTSADLHGNSSLLLIFSNNKTPNWKKHKHDIVYK